MKSQNETRRRLRWIAVKLFDKSVDKATWLEMMRHLGEDFDVRFLTAYRRDPMSIKVCGRPIEYFPKWGKWGLQRLTRGFLMCRETGRRFAESPPDVLLVNCQSSMSFLRYLGRQRRRREIATVLDIRTLPSGPRWAYHDWLLGKSLNYGARHFDGITYITEALREYCIDRYQLPKHRSAIWTSGVNADVFQLKAGCPSDGPFRLIYHGGIISVSRGLDRLIQAMDSLRDLNVHLTLISSLREPAATKWIDRLSLRDRVTLMDTIPHRNVPAQIQCCHAGILPFPSCDVWNTSSPIKLFEYMACGKPVVVTDIPAHRNVLDGRPFAFFAPDASPESLAGAIRKAYAHRDQLGPLGQTAREQVLAEHTWARQAERLTLFLEQLLDW